MKVSYVQENPQKEILVGIQLNSFYFRMRQPVVIIKVEKKQNESRGSQQIGHTGVFITENGLILTSASIVNGADSIKVRPADGIGFSDAVLVGKSDEFDFALLQVSSPNPNGWHYAELAPLDEPVNPGMHVFCIQNFCGLPFSFGIGQVGYIGANDVSLSAHDMQRCFIKLNNMNGDVGAPAFNSRGQIIGIYTCVSCSRNRGCVVHLAHIHEFMAQQLA